MSKLNYAAGTTVAAGQSLGQIQMLLARVGAERFGYFSEPGKVTIVFAWKETMFRFNLPLPDPSDERFTTYVRGGSRYKREENPARELFEKEVDRRWRALAALVKAQLVAVEEGILTIEQALAPHALTASQRTVAEEAAERLASLGGGPLTLPWSGAHG